MMGKLQIVAALELMILGYLPAKSEIAVADCWMTGLVEQPSKSSSVPRHLACQSLHVLKSM